MDLSADLYFLILQKLKEKAIQLEMLIIDKNKSRNEWVEGNDGLSCLEKDLIKGRLSGVILFSANIVCMFLPIHIDR